MSKRMARMSFQRTTFVIVFCCSCVCLIGSFGAAVVLAQDGRVLYTPEELHRHFQNEAEAYVIEKTGESKPLVFKLQSLMHWQNTERSQEQGSMYVWLDGDRPAVLASIFTYEHSNRVFCKHEIISLADYPLTARMANTQVWTPKTPGLKWMPLTGAGEPADLPARRLSQMRAIAREFSGTVTKPKGEVTKLRLLTNPLIRYQPTDQTVVDGAVFSFAVVTDPELLLVIEAIQENGKLSWRYAVASSHYWQLELQRNGEVVWSVPLRMSLETARANQRPDADGAYFTFHAPQSIPPAEQLR